ncbi:MAG: carboxypeptidase regulatory-like domain-containing protein [Saprospiraceae bacterium]
MTIAKQILALSFSLTLSLLSQAQTLRGTIRDADNGGALTGATVMLRYSRGGAAPISLATSPAGEFVFEKIRAGYYSLEITAQGFETQAIAEVNVAAGKEQVLDIALRRSAAQLAEVTISATQPGRRVPLPLGEIPLTRDQTLRFPATFFDPARLATAYPGVAQTDDGTNSLSIRGNSPASVRWRLEGVDIVNPNHLPNAGTFSDRPAGASGGILMFSAQLLDNSSLLTGAMPAGYGDALGGIMDMNLRKGNNRQHEFTAQAGLIGLDLAAEGPLRGERGESRESRERKRNASYLVNYRYSTVGLLGQLGVSFGDEQINFQDLSFKLDFEGRRGRRWSVFGLGGLSENTFRHKSDTSEIKAYKDFFDIDFQSKTGVLGVSNWSPLWRNAWVKVTVAASGQATDRASISSTDFFRDSRDNIDESKISTAITVSQRLWRQFRLSGGIAATRQSFFGKSSSPFYAQDQEIANHKYLSLQPWGQVAWNSKNQNTTASIGLHSLYFKNPYNAFPSLSEYAAYWEPRLAVSQKLAKRHRLSLSAGIHTQLSPQWLLSDEQAFMLGKNIALAYTWDIAPNWLFKAEAYHQKVEAFAPSLPIQFSTLNASEYQPNDYEFFYTIERGSNTGVEFNVERRLADGWFMLANTSIFESKYKRSSSGAWLPSRWDIGHIANLTFGKEWQREKRPGKERTIGLNARAVWAGSPREADINLAVSRATQTTIFDETRGYTYQYPDYFRLDLRVYWRKNLGNRRNSTFALDLQNLTGRQNLAYHYYDAYTNRIETKYQLGTIPNFSWRVEF